MQRKIHVPRLVCMYIYVCVCVYIYIYRARGGAVGCGLVYVINQEWWGGSIMFLVYLILKPRAMKETNPVEGKQARPTRTIPRRHPVPVARCRG
jgi:hypothetical protein